MVCFSWAYDGSFLGEEMSVEQQIQISMLGRFAILVDGVDLVAQLSKSKKGLYLLQ